MLFTEYRNKKLLPQTVSGVLWRHYLHPEYKSLSPDGGSCGPYTSGLLLRRPIEAILPLRCIGKEIERKAQEGEDISAIDSSGPVEYQPGQTRNTRAADPGVILRAKAFGIRELMRESGAGQHAVERLLSGVRIHPATRAKLQEAIERLERQITKSM